MDLRKFEGIYVGAGFIRQNYGGLMPVRIAASNYIEEAFDE